MMAILGILGTIIMAVAAIAALYFSILILIENFKENVLWGLGSLFLGIPMLVFIAMRWDLVGKHFLKYLGCFAVVIIGSILAGLGAAGAASGM